MKSLSTRLTVLYAASFVALTAVALAIGYRQIETKLTRTMDSLLVTERARVFNHLDLGDRTTDVRSKLQRSTDNSAALFLVEIRTGDGKTVFRSRNLPRPLPLPSTGWTFRWASLPSGTGVRVGRFDYRGMVVLIATPTRNVETAMRSYVETSIGLILGMALASVTLGYLLSQVALKPLRQIAATAARVRPDNLTERIAIQRMDDEVGDLARLLNAMLDRIESSFRQIRQFTADASHELKTPLSLVRLHAEGLLADPRCSDSQEDALVAQIEQIDRLAAMIEDLLVLARADSNSLPLALAEYDPESFLEGLRTDAEVLADASGHSVSFAHGGTGNAVFDPRWIRQVIFNLLGNALRAAPAGTTIFIRSGIDGSHWTLAVEDSGKGISADQLPRIFDRFFTTSDTGTGLGLAICRSFIELHSGTIEAEPGDGGRGLKIRFRLPRKPARLKSVSGAFQGRTSGDP